MSVKDIPGYALIVGGDRNGQWTRNGRYYRLSDGHMFDIDGGDVASGPAVDNEASVAAILAAEEARHEAELAELRAAEAAALAAEITVGDPLLNPEPEDAPAPAAKKAAEPAPKKVSKAAAAKALEEKIDALVADFGPKKIKEMLGKLKDDGHDVTIDHARSAKATRNNAAELIKHTEE